MSVRCGALLLLLSLAGVSTASAQLLHEAIETELRPALSARGDRDRGDGVWWQGDVASPIRSQYIRIHISNLTAPPAARYQIVIRDPNERRVLLYPSERITAKAFYTDLLFTSAATIQLAAEKGDSAAGVAFTVDRFLYSADFQGRLTPQSILPTWVSIVEMPLRPPLQSVADGVAKVYMGDGAVCTGFLIADNTLLTNEHCIVHSTEFQGPAKGCGDVRVQFDYDVQARPETAKQTTCASVTATDHDVDFAVLKLSATPPARTGGRRATLKLAGDPAPHDHLLVIHHPAGLPTQVSADCSTFPGTTPATVQHDCSTTAGSSGAPILSSTGEVVALHYEGAFRDDQTIAEINRLLATGARLLNKAIPAAVLRQRFQDLNIGR